MELETSVVFSPRGHEFEGNTTLGAGKTWRSKYASVGVIVGGDMAILDGINEKGLSVGTLDLPGYASYPETTKENRAISMSMSDISQWFISQFADVGEVAQAVRNNEAAISAVLVSGFPPQVQPFHYILHDRSGRSIIVEPLDGNLVVFDNPLGVLTNSPTFDWHMTNLRNYVNLDFDNVEPMKLDGQTFKSFGQGSGMIGLPGDITPPSRFIRAVAFSSAAFPEKTALQGVYQLFHILNNFDIPVGIARDKVDDHVYTDATLLTVARDAKNLRYYYRTYDDQTIRVVDLNRFDFDSKKIKMLTIEAKQTFVDMSEKLKDTPEQGDAPGQGH